MRVVSSSKVQGTFLSRQCLDASMLQRTPMNQPVSLLCRIHQCDGKRPSCTHCVTQGSSCVYLTAAGETRFSALKRKYNSLEEELETLRNLYGYIQSRPLSEAHDLVAVIQSCQDPTEATRRFLLHNDSIRDINAFAEAEISNVFLASGDVETSLAPAHYPVHVLAYPWTTVAGDEVVSKLISQFFIAERSLVLPIVNSSQFIEEMKGGDTTVAMFCSPLLVNAICAHQCVSYIRLFHHQEKRFKLGVCSFCHPMSHYRV